MKNRLIGLGLAGLLAASTAVSAPQQAEARGRGGAVAGAIIGGLVLGGLLGAHRYYRPYYGHRYYGYYGRPRYYGYYRPRYYW